MRPFIIALRFEFRRGVREGVLPALLLLFAVAAVYAAWNGRTWREDQKAARTAALRDTAKFREEVLARYATLLERTPEKAPNTGMLMVGVWYRPTLPVAPLAAVAVGQGEGYPFDLRFHPTNTRAIFAARPITIGNPEVRAAGRFDLAFVVVVVLPLLLLAAVFDVWAAERESGVARLLEAQPVAPGLLLGAKLLARGGSALLGFTGILVAASAWTALPDTGLTGVLPGMALITLIVLSYGAFWLLLARAINMVAASSSQAALAAGATWLAVVALIPAGLSTVRDLLHPAPSWPAQTSALRSAEVELERRQKERAAARGPASSIDRNALVLNSLVESAEDQQLLAEAQASARRQQEERRRWADTYRFLAPSLLVQDALERIAGTDAARANAFTDQALGFIVTVRNLVRQHLRDGKKAASVREYAEVIPQFAFKEAATDERFGPVVINFAVLCAFGVVTWLIFRPKS